MNLKTLCLALGACASGYTLAAPNDLFLQANDFKAQDSALQLTVALDAVNDTIDVFDMRQSEGVSGERGDYIGGHIAAEYQLNPKWSIEGSYYYRDIDLAPDTNTIHSALLGVRYQPELPFLAHNDAIAFRASVWGNRSDELTKSSPTRVNTHTFDQVSVTKPQDLQLQFDALFSRKIDHMNQVNAFASLGYSKVEIENLKMRTLYQGCLADINVGSNNQYTGQLAAPCKIGGSTVHQLEITGDAKDYGLEVDKDLNYDSYFASLGGSWNWRYQQFESQIAYQYQYLWRQDIDDRVAQFGNSAIKDNHQLGLKLSYDLNPKMSAFVQGELYQHNFVGQIPFLYNGTTASRLDKRYGLASIGLRLHSF